MARIEVGFVIYNKVYDKIYIRSFTLSDLYIIIKL